MFKTQQGVIEGQGTDIYLRPETAQGIFVNFKNILDTTRMRVPFGIAQIGKAFRNEITPGNFMFRVREFYQMEIEYFVENDEKIGLKAFKEWMETSKKRWIEEIGINEKKLKFREHDKDELSFYSK
jgi:glycyl-tRNA synthetase